ncbi:hypothetical protein STCU_10353 [Strigomonas culicis]|uniref:Uncharacterized protein n=1 Tax=Strigomonas culicis TaxID=28005 RepID=S9TIE5_9TRYP|nr:hypothetical protein STCU_10353 [Strigomonas culicis]|eukprot:EPY17872.1 hypothetical protein STCU_10353 [Strigomonas culicis]
MKLRIRVERQHLQWHALRLLVEVGTIASQHLARKGVQAVVQLVLQAVDRPCILDGVLRLEHGTLHLHVVKLHIGVQGQCRQRHALWLAVQIVAVALQQAVCHLLCHSIERLNNRIRGIDRLPLGQLILLLQHAGALGVLVHIQNFDRHAARLGIEAVEIRALHLLRKLLRTVHELALQRHNLGLVLLRILQLQLRPLHFL